MNILYVVPYTPNSVRVRPYSLIRSLAARGNRVTLLTLWSDEQERQQLEALRAEGIEVTAFALTKARALANTAYAALTPDPLQSYYCWQPKLAEKLVELALAPGRPYDIVHIEHLRGARFGQHLITRQAGLKTAVPIIWDSVDNITYLFQQAAEKSRKITSRLITRFELLRTRQYETKMARLFAHTLVTSHLDKKAFHEMLPDPADQAKISVLPNGVDLDYFSPLDEPREPGRLVISGKMSYHANVAMTLFLTGQILPLIWARRPEVTLSVVGKDPPAEIRQLSQDPRITITGYVPDLRPYLRRASIALAPLTYGAGIQNKVLEAMACATPVIATPKAVAALSARQGEDILVEQEPEAYAQRVLELLDNPTRARQVGQAGRRFVETCHNWHAAAARLEEIYTAAGDR